MSSALIMKRVRSRGKKQSRRSLIATATYIDNAAGHGDKIHVLNGMPVQGAFNVLSDNRTKQVQEIARSHALYRGTGRMLDHIIISYRSDLDDSLTAEDFRRDVKSLLKHLGMAEHACLYTVHSNTENIHTHILLDRVSLEPNAQGELFIPVNVGTVTSINAQGKVRRNDALCMHAAMYEICRRRGYDTSFCLVDNKGQRLKKSSKTALSNAATQTELRTGLKSPERLLLEKVNALLPIVKGWKDVFILLNMHRVIMELSYNKDGQPKGAVFMDAYDRTIQVKSSRLLDENSFKGLQRRFGPIDEKTLTLQSYLVSMPALYPKNITVRAAKKKLKKILDTALVEASSWGAIAHALAQENFNLIPSGGSYVIAFNKEQDKVKLSEIDRRFSKKKIEDIFKIKSILKENSLSDSAQSVQYYENILKTSASSSDSSSFTKGHAAPQPTLENTIQHMEIKNDDRF